MIAGLTCAWAMIDFGVTMNDRARAVQRLGIYSSASDLREIELLDQQERSDGIVVTFSLMGFIAGCGMMGAGRQNQEILQRLRNQELLAHSDVSTAPVEKVVSVGQPT